MDEERSHLVVRVRYEGISPHHDGTQHRAIGKDKACGEESASDGRTNKPVWQPEIGQNQEVSEVAEIEQEVVKLQLFVGIPTIGQQEKSFLKDM